MRHSQTPSAATPAQLPAAADAPWLHYLPLPEKLFELAETALPELWIQHVWGRQLLLAEPVCTSGQSLRVLHPGRWNAGAGPDFADALLLVDGQLRRGSVEIHTRSSDFIAHGHQRDPAYHDLALHVVWEDDRPGAAGAQVPVLELQRWSQLGREELQAAVGDCPAARRQPPAPVRELLAPLPLEELRALLRLAGARRWQERLQLCREMSRSLGADQAVYTALLDAMGYSANRRPFQELAARAPIALLLQESALQRRARLWGEAGLLPDPSQLPAQDCPEDLQQLWHAWWAQRRASVSPLTWRRHGLRPVNTPERRLAGALELLQRMQCRPAAWLQEGLRQGWLLLPKLLWHQLEVEGAEWAGRLDFTRPLGRPAKLIGRSRATELAVNVILPFAAVLQPDRAPELAACWAGLEAGDTNAKTREAALTSFMPPALVRMLGSDAALQQGLIFAAKDPLAFSQLVWQHTSASQGPQS